MTCLSEFDMVVGVLGDDSPVGNLVRRRNTDNDNNDPLVQAVQAVPRLASLITAYHPTRNRPLDTFVTDVVRRDTGSRTARIMTTRPHRTASDSSESLVSREVSSKRWTRQATARALREEPC